MTSLWLWLSLGLFLALLVCLELGYRVGKGHIATHETDEGKSPNLLSGIVYGLLSLLLSFSFAIAMQRFDARRRIVVDEGNAVGTAYLRLDLLPTVEQPPFRKEFRRYADTRLDYTKALDNGLDTEEFTKATASQQKLIWTMLMAEYQRDPRDSTRIQLTPAINAMFDVAATRDESVKTRVPLVIYLLLGGVSLASALMAGRNLAARPTREWGQRILFSGVLAAVMFVIADLDSPRQGYIRVDTADQILKDVRSSMQ